METRVQYRLRLTDETDQKTTTITTTGDTLWAEVGAIGVSGLDLPVEIGGEPVVYHLFDDSSGEALLPGQTVGEVLKDNEVEAHVCLSPEMKPA